MKYEFTRATIIRAIKKEPLRAGDWFYGSPDSKSCEVCAVGAVLRNSLPTKVLSDDDFDAFNFVGSEYCHDNDIVFALKTENYLGALSVKFERLCYEKSGNIGSMNDLNKRQMNSVRNKLVEWVKENLPVRFEVKV